MKGIKFFYGIEANGEKSEVVMTASTGAKVSLPLIQSGTQGYHEVKIEGKVGTKSRTLKSGKTVQTPRVTWWGLLELWVDRWHGRLILIDRRKFGERSRKGYVVAYSSKTGRFEAAMFNEAQGVRVLDACEKIEEGKGVSPQVMDYISIAL